MKCSDFTFAINSIGLAVGDDLPFSCIRINGDRIIARNRSTSAVSKISSNFMCDILIDYKSAMTVAKRMPATANVVYDETSGKIIIKEGRARASINSVPDDIDSISPLIINHDNSIRFDVDDEFTSTVKLLSKYQSKEDIQPEWFSALIIINGKLLVISSASTIIAWTEDKWFRPNGVEDLIIPRKFCEHISSFDMHPEFIEKSGNIIHAQWPNGSSFSTTQMSGRVSQSLINIIENWRQPEWEMSDDFIDAANLVCDLAHGNLSIGEDEITGVSQVGNVSVENEIDLPSHPNVVMQQHVLKTLITGAEKWQITDGPTNPFVYKNICGLFASRSAE